MRSPGVYGHAMAPKNAEVVHVPERERHEPRDRDELLGFRRHPECADVVDPAMRGQFE